MSEWSSIYNPFNSMKALVHAKHFEAILEGKVLPPLVVNMDLTNRCNYDCRFCMFGNRERTDPTGQGFRFGKEELPIGYATTLPKIWKIWEVKAVCLAGGGEPTLHSDCLPFIRECGKEGLELGFVSNGLLVNSERWWKAINENCRFVGFSVDAGNALDYAKTKNVPSAYFQKVINNMRKIADFKERMGTNLQIGYKFVLDEMNYLSIYEAAKEARDAGANHFQFRPAIHPNVGFFKEALPIIWGQIERAQRELETPDFRVFGVKHKFNPDLSKKHDFQVCRANLLTTTWAADGKVYMCTDTRGNPWSYLVDHFPDPQKVIDYWGSHDHLNKVRKIDFKSNCDRCTLGPANEIFEHVFINDEMDRNLI